ncbi:MAG: hypothetical protein O7J95_18560 [Planctomycetota bacterium]|nr:hypothetical protein [Planctomycetota bacterium]
MSRSRLAQLAALVLFLTASCARRDATPGEEGHGEEGSGEARKEGLTVELPDVGASWHPGRWNQLRLEVGNTGKDFDGHVEVRGFLRTTQAWDSTVTRTPLKLPRGGVQEVALPVRPAGWEYIRVRLESPEETLVRRFDLAVPGGDSSKLALVLGIGEHVPDLGALVKELGGLTGQTVRSRRLGPREIPTLPAGYDAYQLVMLYRSSLETASPDAVDALARWVEAGGTLVAFPGPEWSASIPGRLRDVLGVESVDADALMPLALEERLGGALRDGRDEIYGVYRQLTPRVAARLRDDGLLAVHRPGAGLALTFSVTPSAAVFPGHRELPAVHRWLRPAFRRSSSFAGLALSRLDGVQRAAAGALRAASGFRVPPAGWVVLALLAYLVFGFFVPGAIFKRLGRREWTFAVIAVAACLSTYGVYRFGLLSAVPGFSVDDVTVLRMHADGQAAEATSFVGCISPSFRRVELQPAPAKETNIPLLLAGPLQPPADSLDAGPRTDVLFDRRKGMSLAPITLYPNGPRSFRFDYRTDANHFLEVSGSGERRTLTNRSAQPIETAFVVEARLHRGPTIAPGDEIPVTWPEIGDWQPLDDYVFRSQEFPSQPGVPGSGLPRVGLEIALAALALQGEDLDRLAGRYSARGYTYYPRGGRTTVAPPLAPDPRERVRFLVAWNDTPTFPDPPGTRRRHGVTVAVIEFPFPIEE